MWYLARKCMLKTWKLYRLNEDYQIVGNEKYYFSPISFNRSFKNSNAEYLSDNLTSS